jgi:SAM-dependent methyltransferase
MDLDGRFLRSLNYANLNVRENVVDADFSSGTFDLVHTRWTLMHIPERERVLQTFADCLAPGGTLFLEEPDSISVRTLDRTGFKRCRCACSRSSSHVDGIRTGAVTCRSKWRRSGSPTCAQRVRPHIFRAPRSSPSSGGSVGGACATRSLSQAQTSPSGTASWPSSTIRRGCS